MTFNRTLSQLADEYFEQAQVLDGIIARHRKRLSALPNPETSDEAYKIKTLLNVLYKERRDVLETANYLKDNYSGRKTDERYKNNNISDGTLGLKSRSVFMRA